MTTAHSAPVGAAWKLGLLASLYFSQGLPFGFFSQALPVLLRQQGFSLGEIGLSSLLALPWALKFLWAPLVDRYGAARLGRRKSWIVPLQLAAVLVLLALAGAADAVPMRALLGAVLLLNLIAATQDIATDGLAVDLLAPSERGFANGLQVAGYRVGMIVGGGALLVLHERLGSFWVFACMALATLAASLPIVLAREPARPVAASAAAPSLGFLRRPGAARLLALIVVYKFGDAFATAMLRPFLADAGFGLAQIGWLLGTIGFGAGLVGALLGGALVNRLGRRSALLWFGLAQAAAVAGYAWLSLHTPSWGWLALVCALEHLAGGMATAALFTCMMDWCARESGASDYTLQASAVVIASGVASSLAGFSAQALGYLGHFVAATLLSLLSLLVVRRCFPSAAASEGSALGAPALSL